MVPYTITHCINYDTSFLLETRDIKYHILYILIEYLVFMLPKVCV